MGYITEKQGCEKYVCCRTTFRKLADKADAKIFLGKSVRYDLEKIEAYLEAEKHTTDRHKYYHRNNK